jgi:hypothetical protein
MFSAVEFRGDWWLENRRSDIRRTAAGPAASHSKRSRKA